MRPPGCSFRATVRQIVPRALGLTHASRVMPVVRSKVAESAIVTHALVPLNDSALPNLPAVLQVALLIVPGLPLPDESLTVVPVPSLTPWAAANPADLPPVTVTETEALVA